MNADLTPLFSLICLNGIGYKEVESQISLSSMFSSNHPSYSMLCQMCRHVLSNYMFIAALNPDVVACHKFPLSVVQSPTVYTSFTRSSN